MNSHILLIVGITLLACTLIDYISYHIERKIKHKEFYEKNN